MTPHRPTRVNSFARPNLSERRSGKRRGERGVDGWMDGFEWLGVVMDGGFLRT
jgi:hypothetical protein